MASQQLHTSSIIIGKKLESQKFKHQLNMLYTEIFGYLSSSDKNVKLRHLNTLSQFSYLLDQNILHLLFLLVMQDNVDTSHKAAICYAVGQSNHSSLIPLLKKVIHPDQNEYVRNEARAAKDRLESQEIKEFNTVKKDSSKKLFNKMKSLGVSAHVPINNATTEYNENALAYVRDEHMLRNKYPNYFVSYCNGLRVYVHQKKEKVAHKALEQFPGSFPYIRKIGPKL